MAVIRQELCPVIAEPEVPQYFRAMLMTIVGPAVGINLLWFRSKEGDME
jgi:hypothetical protein